MRYKMTKNIKFVIIRFVFFKLKMHQNPFSAGALPRTPLGELTTLPQTPKSAGEGDNPSPFPSARRLWSLELGASVLRPPQHKILATPVVDTAWGPHPQTPILRCVITLSSSSLVLRMTASSAKGTAVMFAFCVAGTTTSCHYSG